MRRITELDGLRSVAILMVIAFHLLRVPHHHFLEFPARLFSIGWAGVDVFFTLSGFLIGGILIDTRGSPGALSSYFVRRAARILPLYYVVIGGFYLVREIVDAPWLFAGTLPAWSYLSMTQNFAQAFLNRDALILSPTWSLAVEVQVYLLLGILLTRAPARSLAALMVAGVILAVTCRVLLALAGHAYWGYFVLPARIDGACIGVLAAIAMRRPDMAEHAARHHRVGWFAVAVLTASATALAATGHGIGTIGSALFNHLAINLATALAIILLSTTDCPINTVLRWRPLVWLGGISYGVYLLHLPIVGLAHALLGSQSFVPDNPTSIAASCLGIVATIALSWISFRLFEQPINRWAHRVTKGRSAFS